MTESAATPIASGQVGAVADALARGFFNDPLQRYVLPDEAERSARAPRFFAALVCYGHLFGDAFTIGDPAGAAVWFRPGDVELAPKRLAESGMADMSRILGEDAFARLNRIVAPLEALRRSDAPARHWYLAVLGVDLPLQGRGIGGALIAPVLARADAESLACYLETQNERNVAFYERHGFEVKRVIDDRPSGVVCWTFLRPAASN